MVIIMGVSPLNDRQTHHADVSLMGGTLQIVDLARVVDDHVAFLRTKVIPVPMYSRLSQYELVEVFHLVVEFPVLRTAYCVSDLM